MTRKHVLLVLDFPISNNPVLSPKRQIYHPFSKHLDIPYDFAESIITYTMN